MKKISRLFGGLFAGLLLWTGCNDALSPIGNNILPGDDILHPGVDSFKMESRTIAIDSLYDRGTTGLLGHFRDGFYGTYRASYISRLQHAPGFAFPKTPHKDKILKTFVRLRYNKWVGDSTIYSKATVFEVTKPLPNDRYTHDLSPYLEGAVEIGELTYKAGDPQGTHELIIPIDNKIGERFYKASKESPEFFESQQSFEENLLRGLFIKSSTGSGCMINVYSTELVIGYEYEFTGKNTANTADSTYLIEDEVAFVNTGLLYMHRDFEITNIDELLKPSKEYAYITSPGGLALSLRLPASEMESRLVRNKDNDPNLTRVISGAPINLSVDVPPSASTILQPPSYLLLIPKDSLDSYFVNGYTELTQPKISFLSGMYNINHREYSFENVSLLLNEHIAKHMTKGSDGQYEIKKDLELLVIPVTRETSSSGGSSSTVKLRNYMFPSAVRIKLEEGNIKLKVISTLYQSN